MPANAKPVEYVETDFGFVLYEEHQSFEAYGMAGLGRYELFWSTDLDDSVDRGEFSQTSQKMEADKGVVLTVYRRTKKALVAEFRV